MIESGDIRFITGIDGTVAVDDRCTRVTSKCSPYHSRFDFLYAI